MASEKLIRILRSRGAPFSDTELAALPEAEGWSWVYENRPPRQEKLPEVCFTGFRPEEKAELAQLAANAGLKVAKSVTKGLLYLCAGPTPGPAKLERARRRNVTVLSSDEFRRIAKGRQDVQESE